MRGGDHGRRGLRDLRGPQSLRAGRHEWDRFLTAAFWYQWPYAGPAVIGAWLALLLTKRRRAEPSSIDRLGRLIAACWLIEFVLGEMPGRRWIPRAISSPVI